MEMETIDISPSWRTAVSIYIEVLLNNDYRHNEGVVAATEDLLRLADVVDGMNESNGVTIDPDQLTIQFGD
jgi:hypothetical protein